MRKRKCSLESNEKGNPTETKFFLITAETTGKLAYLWIERKFFEVRKRNSWEMSERKLN